MVEVAAHARLLGENWRQAIGDDRGEIDALMDVAVLQRTIDLRAERDERLAVMIGNQIARVLGGK